jgi:hypothetical protein
LFSLPKSGIHCLLLNYCWGFSSPCSHSCPSWRIKTMIPVNLCTSKSQ